MAGPPPAFRDQRHVAGVERAHGRNEGDRAAVRARSAASAALSASMSRTICTLVAASDISLGDALAGGGRQIKAKKSRGADGVAAFHRFRQ